MQKDLDKQLRLDTINWAEVIEGLEGKTTFGTHDIKRALRKTGRSFNNNGPFYTVVKKFIKALGSTVKSEKVSGEMVYTLTSTEDAIKAVSRKRKPSTKGKTSGLAVLGLGEKQDDSKSIPNPIPTPISNEDKIKDLFKRSYTSLEHAIYLLAIYIRHSETSLSGKIIKTELTDLGVKTSTFNTQSRPVITQIFELLGFNKLTVIKLGSNGSIWKMEGQSDLLDEYTCLTEIYEKLTGTRSRNLDDYITSTSVSKAGVIRRYELLKELEEKQKETPRQPRIEKDPEIVWKKWLLISASKFALGALRSLSSLLTWIKTSRHYEIDEEEAKKLCRELMEDSESGFKIDPSYSVSLNNDAWKRLSKFYSPSTINETIYVKLPLSLEFASNAFPDLDFKLDETTSSGMYLYKIQINRGIKHELALKKLLRFIQITGKLYTDNSWMIERVKKIISKEDSDEKSKNLLLFSLED